MGMKHAFCILMLAVICLLPAAYAGENIQQVQAYVNKDIRIIYDSQPLTFEADGTVLSPLVYQGVTYVPLLSLSEQISLEARWDQEDFAMYLGPSEEGTNFIDMFEPYATSGRNFARVDSSMGMTEKIASKIHTKWLDFYVDRSTPSSAYYDLGGQYTTLTFKAYTPDGDDNLIVMGDNKAVLGKYKVIDKNLPQTITVDVKNVIQLELHCESVSSSYNNDFYIVDAYIK